MSVWYPLFCVLFVRAAAQTDYLNFWIPGEIAYGDTVNINCKPNDAGIAHFAVVSRVELYRQRENEPMKLIVRASYVSQTSSTNVEWFDSVIDNKGRLTASLGPPSSSMFRLRLDDVDCTDQGEYKCVVTDSIATGNRAEKLRKTIVKGDSTGVYPITTTYINGVQNTDISQLAIFAALRTLTYTSRTTYPSGSVALFNCVASPGFPAPKLRWCIKRPGAPSFQSFNFISIQRKTKASSSAQACLYSSSNLMLFPVQDSDNGTSLSCAVTDEECGTVPTPNPISKPDKPLLSLVMSQSQTKEREIIIYIGEDKTHVGVQAEENRASQTEQTDNSSMVVLGIAVAVIVSGIILLTVAVVTYLKAKRIEEVEKNKASRSNQYSDLERPRRGVSVHSEVYEAIENLPPDLPASGKPYQTDDMYMLPIY